VLLGVELLAMRSAWLGRSERFGVLLVATGLLVAAASLATIWVACVRRPLWVLAPLWLPVGLLAGRTATMARIMGPFSSLMVLVTAMLALVLWRLRPRSSWERRLWAATAATAFVAAGLLPARVPEVEPVGLLALGLGLFCGSQARWAQVRLSTVAMVAVATALLGGWGSAWLGPNPRFVLAAQTRLVGWLVPPRGSSPVVRAAGSLPAADPWAALSSLQGLGAANLILVTVDAERADSPILPGPLVFTTAYAGAPRTALSLASLLTGRSPGGVLQKTPDTIATELDRRRWYTAAWYPAGVFFDNRAQLARYADQHFGFDWADTRTLGAAELTDAVLARLDELSRTGQPRAFLWIHYFDAHEPYEAHPPVTAQDPPRRRYQSELDDVARQLTRLKAGLAKLSRPSLLVLTADHGEEFGEHGGAYHGTSLYDEQLRVPLSLSMPGMQPTESDLPVELADLLPQLLPLLDENFAKQPPAHDVRAEVDRLRMLRRGRYKLIHDLRHDVDQLFDLETDPGEQHNLASTEPVRLAELQDALLSGFGLRRPSDLVAILADERQSPSLRSAVARELGEREAPIARDTLLEVLAHHPPPELEAEAALGLGALEDPRAEPALLRLLSNPAQQARAAIALGRLRNPVAVPVLLATLHDIHVELRRHAAHYLGHLGDAAVAHLLLRLDDERIRNEVYEAVGRIAARLPPTEAAPLYTELQARLRTEQHDDARRCLERALPH